ncbi:hypothetical protein [Lactiplantibacillus plantarum]|uniref:hypothetical protein n=1 Tax=Lactiplantibacillus plantarum TaxID=1590 RepID=UPI00404662B4
MVKPSLSVGDPPGGPVDPRGGAGHRGDGGGAIGAGRAGPVDRRGAGGRDHHRADADAVPGPAGAVPAVAGRRGLAVPERHEGGRGPAAGVGVGHRAAGPERPRRPLLPPARRRARHGAARAPCRAAVC